MSEKEERGFIVVDRRGQEDGEEAKPSEADETAAPADVEEGPTAARSPERPLPEIDFATFILSLSTSALYHLGLVADPETGEPVPPDVELARQSIDTLALLERKTQGNLEPEEQKLLENLLYELRLRFVEVSGSG